MITDNTIQSPEISKQVANIDPIQRQRFDVVNVAASMVLEASVSAGYDQLQATLPGSQNQYELAA